MSGRVFFGFLFGAVFLCGGIYSDGPYGWVDMCGCVENDFMDVPMQDAFTQYVQTCAKATLGEAVHVDGDEDGREEAQWALLPLTERNLIAIEEKPIPVVWMPPMNGIQGRLLRLVQKERGYPHAIDWNDILDMEPLDYSGDEESIQWDVAICAYIASKEPHAVDRLCRLLRRHLSVKEGRDV